MLILQSGFYSANTTVEYYCRDILVEVLQWLCYIGYVRVGSLHCRYYNVDVTVKRLQGV